MADLPTAFSLPLLQWLDIPGGQVTLADGAGAFEVEPFKIAKYPVTNEQFNAFIRGDGYKNIGWWQGLTETVKSSRASDWRDLDAPKLEVSWFEAAAFTQWLSDQTNLNVRLPTEWEWQWAAVGDSGWDYPYGSVFDSAQCNTKESAVGRTNAVTHYAAMKTHFDTVDMAGNVWEWCLNEGAAPLNVQIDGLENRALRGGSWNNAAKNASAVFRGNRTPKTRAFNIGFRVIIAP